MDVNEEMAELSSAEEFLELFDLPYEPAVVQVNRLHILQRFHDYLRAEPNDGDNEARRVRYKALLWQAYQDFVRSDARTEKVFQVFRMGEPQTVRIGIDQIRRSGT